jgi:hypothetical protein
MGFSLVTSSLGENDASIRCVYRRDITNRAGRSDLHGIRYSVALRDE